jgi:predicted permease
VQLANFFESVGGDLRYAARGFRRNPGFALTALLAIAIGVGSAAAVFSVVDRILFRALPYAAGDRLVTFGLVAPIEDREFMLGPDYVEWRRSQTPFAAMTSFDAAGVTDCDITAQPPVRQRCAAVEANFLPTLGVRPLLGRNFTAEEDRPKGPGAALISYGLWKSRFGGDRDAVGKTISLDNEATTVVGVLPAGFEFPTLAPVDILVPLQLDEAAQKRPNTGAVLRAYARLKDGVTPAQAAAALGPQFQDSLQYVPPAFRKDVRLSVRSVRELQTENVKSASWILMGAVLAVLLIACANVANLLLARFVMRQREFAVRAALGAGRGRLVRQALTESLLLGIAGGAGGCLLAWWLLKAFVAIAPQGIPRLGEASLDARVLLFALAATVASAALFGVAPALQSLRAEALAGGRAAGGKSGMLHPALAAGQVAASLVLLTAASLLLRSFRNIEAVPLGMETQSVLTANIVLGAANYAQPGQQQAFFEQLETRLRQIPGAATIAVSDSLPPSGQMHGGPFNGLEVEGEPRRSEENEAGGMVGWRIVTPGYFRALEIPIVRGRGFEEADRSSSDNAIILSETLAQRLLPGKDALGTRIAPYRGSPWFTVIGVAANVKNGGILAPDDPEYYVVRKHAANYGREGGTAFEFGRRASVIVRSAQNPKAMAGWIRAEVAALDPALPVTVETMEQRVGALTARPRFNAALLGLFAGAGVLLAGIGLYGVISFLVVRRTREIGVRMALGATPGGIAALVLARAGRWAAAGIVLGLAGSFFAARVMEALLYGVKPGDPATLAGVTALLLAIALAAAWIPARRAARIDPVEALREE